MKNRIIRLALALVLLAAGSLPIASAESGKTYVDIQENEDGPVRRYSVLSEPQLRERMQRAVAWADPEWIIQAPSEDISEAHRLRALNGTNEKRRQWERDHSAFGNFVRNRIREGAKGRSETPQKFTMAPAEFISLALDPTDKWQAPLRKWANRSGPGNIISQSLAGAANYARTREADTGQKPTEADEAFSAMAKRTNDAYSAWKRGKATKEDMETLRAFVAAMK